MVGRPQDIFPVQARLFPDDRLSEKNAEIEDDIEAADCLGPRYPHLIESSDDGLVAEVGECVAVIGKPSRHARNTRIIEAALTPHFPRNACSAARRVVR